VFATERHQMLSVAAIAAQPQKAVLKTAGRSTFFTALLCRLLHYD
jgi:hypothetical protein